ncbi:GDCCVxC domain-containing (seleno)protein [Bradyrhizobium sp. 31Argb]|uniref:GDCCVxC domain-containing (seleno)protein n=1 Tax=Bradyrhizobium sp. 31Argb TaxID=3141247 RepID=UPI0037481925
MQDNSLILQSIITCPHCGYREMEIMPLDACRFFYDCKACGAHLKPKPGDCCVFCSYGTVPCPPVQASRGASTCACSAGDG